MDKIKVFLTEKIHDDAVTFLKSHGEVIQGTSTKVEDIIIQAQGCQGILIRSAKITKEIMEKTPELRVIAKHGIGVDNIDVDAATELGILVVNAPFSNVNAVAEHSLALILGLSKNLVLLDKETRKGEFIKRNQYINLELKGKKIGLIGLGKISKLLAEKLIGLGVIIMAYDPYAKKEEAEVLGIKLLELEPLILESDIISLHVPLTSETNKMVNVDFLKKMKKSALLINVARGPIVDEEALYKAVISGEIAGAAIDVFDPEPPKDDNPLFNLEQVVFSPHNAALTDNALWAMAMDSAKGIIDYLEEKTPEFPVNQNVLNKGV